MVATVPAEGANPGDAMVEMNFVPTGGMTGTSLNLRSHCNLTAHQEWALCYAPATDREKRDSANLQNLEGCGPYGAKTHLAAFPQHAIPLAAFSDTWSLIDLPIDAA